MKKVQEYQKHYKITIRKKNKGYSARITLKIGGGVNPRPERNARSRDMAVAKLLIYIQEVFEENIKKGLYNASYITFEAYNKISQSIQEEKVATAAVIRELNKISSKYVKDEHELITPVVNNNSLLQQVTSTSIPNNVQNNGQNNVYIPNYTNVNNLTPSVANNTSLALDYNQCMMAQQQLYDVDKLMKTTLNTLCDKWFKYKLSLCKGSEDNVNPLSQKTVDGYNKTLINVVIKYFDNNKLIYVSQINEDILKHLIKSEKRLC